MNKKIFGKKLKRDKNERQALFKNLMSALVLHEKIETTEGKARAIRSQVEKLVTKAKSSTNSAKLILEKNLSKPAFDKMVKEIGPRFSKRNGGYTRIIKIGRRFGDDSPSVVMEWVEKPSAVALIPTKLEKKAAKTTKKVEKSKPVKKETKKAVKKTVTKKLKGK